MESNSFQDLLSVRISNGNVNTGAFGEKMFFQYSLINDITPIMTPFAFPHQIVGSRKTQVSKILTKRQMIITILIIDCHSVWKEFMEGKLCHFIYRHGTRVKAMVL
jgi:hypothetical protein